MEPVKKLPEAGNSASEPRKESGKKDNEATILDSETQKETRNNDGEAATLVDKAREKNVEAESLRNETVKQQNEAVGWDSKPRTKIRKKEGEAESLVVKTTMQEGDATSQDSEPRKETGKNRVKKRKKPKVAEKYDGWLGHEPGKDGIEATVNQPPTTPDPAPKTLSVNRNTNSRAAVREPSRPRQPVVGRDTYSTYLPSTRMGRDSNMTCRCERPCSPDYAGNLTCYRNRSRRDQSRYGARRSPPMPENDSWLGELIYGKTPADTTTRYGIWAGKGMNYGVRTYDRSPIRNSLIPNEEVKDDFKPTRIRKQETGKDSPGAANHASEEMKRGFERLEKLIQNQTEETVRLRRTISKGFSGDEEEDYDIIYERRIRKINTLASFSKDKIADKEEETLKTISKPRLRGAVECNNGEFVQLLNSFGLGNITTILPCKNIDLLFTKSKFSETTCENRLAISKALTNYLTSLNNYGEASISIVDFCFKKKEDVKKNHDMKGRDFVYKRLLSNSYKTREGGLRHAIRDYSLKFEVTKRWGRFIMCEGITTLGPEDYHVNHEIVYPPISELKNLSGDDYNNYEGFNSLFDLHLSCFEHPVSWTFDGRYQMTFYEVIKRSPAHEHWATGTIYSQTNTSAKVKFRKACVTFGLYRHGYENYLDQGAANWTIVACTPSDFCLYSKSEEQEANNKKRKCHPFRLLQNSGGHEAVLPEQALLQLLGQALKQIVARWNELSTILNSLFVGREGATFMNPDDYVHLLYDEATFPRSKFYFWAIGCLSNFEDNIVENLRQLRAVRKFLVNKVLADIRRKEYGNEEKEHIEMLDAHLQPLCRELDDIAKQFGKRLATVQALRDGLSSASGVMETRQSRILGENMRLLTFVNTFFLPLTFCAAVWSIPAVNTTWSGVPTPLCVAVVVGIATYFVVFNLDSLQFMVQWVLAHPRKYLIDKMKSIDTVENHNVWEKDSLDGQTTKPEDTAKEDGNSPSKVWSTRGKAFDVFPRPDQNPKPSAWWLVVFTVRLFFLSTYKIMRQLWLKLPTKYLEIKSKERDDKPQDLESGVPSPPKDSSQKETQPTGPKKVEAGESSTGQSKDQ